MPRPLPLLLALALGVGAALLVACGTGTEDGIPAADASELKSQLEDVRQAVDAGRCDDVPGQVRQVVAGVDRLPSSVDARLRDELRNGAERLRNRAIEECNAGLAEPTTTETQPSTQTQTQTTPTVTTTVPTTTTPTTTQPPADTVTTPPTTQAPAPPEPVEPAPGGGTPPEIQP